MSKIRRALISVSDKAGVVELARALARHRVEILSTGGTAGVLKKAGLPVTDVASYAGSPEILGGRVKTLHPKIHGGILGRRSDPRHAREMEAAGIGPIDMVVVNLYPFEETAAKPGCKLDDAIEDIDIGGPSMLRSAAKNFEDVAAVCDPADYDALIAEMEANGGALTAETRFRLAKKAFALTARYDAAISNFLSRLSDAKEAREWPASLGLSFELVQALRYGENPHQRAAFYRDAKSADEPCIAAASQLQGKELSHNNIMDADAAIEAAKDLGDEPFAAVIVKHASPCGAAISRTSLADAFVDALAGDPVSAFGGIVALTRPVDAATAKLILNSFFEVIAAPGFDPDAVKLLAEKKNLRLIEVAGLGRPFTSGGLALRKVTGGLLVQDRDASREDVRQANVVTRRAPTEGEWKGLSFAWRVAKHAKSNAVVYTDERRTLAIGAGQTSRVDAVRIAGMKMKGVAAAPGLIVLASDAFFPFHDGVDAAAEAGATAIVQPGGSVRDGEVIAAADERGMAMAFTGVRHFRH